MLLSVLALTLAAAPDVGGSVVRIETYRVRYDWTNPWRSEPGSTISGTGFVIAGDRILTNAHVVSDARQITVKRSDTAVPTVATVEAIGHDCDLAILKVADKEFLKGVPSLEFGGLPAVRSQVLTYGYPMGGVEVSSTAGIVSRVEFQHYSHSGNDEHLAVQTDAAINPGNSGGPVVQDGKVVGVAFQGVFLSQSIGYFIPVPVVMHFLSDLRDGHYDGFPDSGVAALNLISPALRRERGLPASKSGVVIQTVQRGATADGILEEGDVLTEIDGMPVADDGHILVAGQRVSFHHAFDEKQIGEPVRLKLWRGGKELERSAPSRRVLRNDRMRVTYDARPRYLIYAGMVFVPLDVTLLATLEGKQKLDKDFSVRSDLIWRLGFRPWEHPESADKEVVVFTHLLPHSVNSQMFFVGPEALKTINGQEVTSLNGLAEQLSANKERFQVFQYEHSTGFEAVDREQGDRATKEILDTYGIASDRNL